MPLEPGENHGLLITSYTSLPSRANYMGPGTALNVRIPRGDKGLTPVDKASKAHDLRYSLYGEKGEQQADQKFNDTVDIIARHNKDWKFNIQQAKLVKLKSLLGLNANLFTTLNPPPENLRPLFEQELQRLEKMGYGV
eukprot:Lithocolla_globosa_v1_NODE_767_length_3315_cov_1264.642025.p3 type:complete len:138 gc:universal NODE_767_length_3315_cov_1264.642025:1569-1982(+)